MIDQALTFAPGWGWLLLAYTIGTVFGMKLNFNRVIGMTIDNLIENGFLRHRTNDDGEVEILPYKEK